MAYDQIPEYKAKIKRNDGISSVLHFDCYFKVNNLGSIIVFYVNYYSIPKAREKVKFIQYFNISVLFHSRSSENDALVVLKWTRIIFSLKSNTM